MSIPTSSSSQEQTPYNSTVDHKRLDFATIIPMERSALYDPTETDSLETQLSFITMPKSENLQQNMIQKSHAIENPSVQSDNLRMTVETTVIPPAQHINDASFEQLNTTHASCKAILTHDIMETVLKEEARRRKRSQNRGPMVSSPKKSTKKESSQSKIPVTNTVDSLINEKKRRKVQLQRSYAPGTPARKLQDKLRAEEEKERIKKEEELKKKLKEETEYNRIDREIGAKLDNFHLPSSYYTSRKQPNSEKPLVYYDSLKVPIPSNPIPSPPGVSDTLLNWQQSAFRQPSFSNTNVTETPADKCMAFVQKT